MRPVIGITCSYDFRENRYFLAEAYVDAVSRAGGMPVILPGIANIQSLTPYLKSIQGLVLAGGGDVDPAYFNEEPHPALGEITPDRDRFEIMLVKAAMRKKMPILGICRGIQVLNIACGGTVMQHIPSEIRKPLKHSQLAPRSHPSHRIFIDGSSRLARISMTAVAKVNSFHHQAVRVPAPGFIVSARSSDGVIEAIENPKYKFVLGVQWHPECLTGRDRKARLLFKALVDACTKAKVPAKQNFKKTIKQPVKISDPEIVFPIKNAGIEPLME